MDRIERETMARQWLAASLQWSATLDRCRVEHEARGRVLALERRDIDVDIPHAPGTGERDHRVA
jgi:hypothetical protein